MSIITNIKMTILPHGGRRSRARGRPGRKWWRPTRGDVPHGLELLSNNCSPFTELEAQLVQVNLHGTGWHILCHHVGGILDA